MKPEELHPILWKMLIGRELGRGASRIVYENKCDHASVFKVCEDSTHWHQNLMEWEAWNHVARKPALRKWFAPCIAISPCGRLLLQKRADNLNINDIPKQMPHFMDDFALANFGRYEGRVVARDYGTLMSASFCDRIHKPLSMKKVKFYA